MAAAVVDRIIGGYAQSSVPLVTMMDMLLLPESSAMVGTPVRLIVRLVAGEISREVFISKVE
jgi:hypothetical protein